MSEWTCWWHSQSKGFCSPPYIIFHEPLSGNLLSAALCVLDLCLLARAVHPPMGLFHPGLYSMRRCSQLEPSFRVILYVPVLGIMQSASPFSLLSAMRVMPALRHSIVFKPKRVVPGKASFDGGECHRDWVLNQCGKNQHGNTLSFILKSMVFILRRPFDSEGSTDRKPGPDCLQCSYDQSGRELRSWVGASSIKRLQEVPLHPSSRPGSWLASSVWVPKQAGEGNLGILSVL